MFRLDILTGHLAGKVLGVMPGKMRIGRNPTCDLLFFHRSVSRNHALLLTNRDSCHVLDLWSRGGTRVNGTRIESMTLLRHHDRLEFGNETMIFSAGDEQVSGVIVPKISRREVAFDPTEAVILHSRTLLGMQFPGPEIFNS